MNVTVIIPTHNRIRPLINLLEQLHLQQKNVAKNAKISMVVVADGCTDNTINQVRKNFGAVHIVEGDGSWWYTKSINEGCKYARILKPQLILLLNDDVILNNNYLTEIIAGYISLGAQAILGSACFTKSTPHKAITTGNIWKNQLLGALRPYVPLLTPIQPDKLSGLKNTITLPGRGMLIPWKILEALNFFDEKFVQYHSDGDFCLRAMQKQIPIYINYNAIVYVNLNETSNSTSYLNKSFGFAIKSFFNKYSRNYLPSKFCFVARHQHLLLAPFITILFVFIVIRNTFKNK